MRQSERASGRSGIGNDHADLGFGNVKRLRQLAADAEAAAIVSLDHLDGLVRQAHRRREDAPVRRVDDPEPTPGKNVAHPDPSQTAAEPFTVGSADRVLVDPLAATGHWPTLPAARR